MPVKDSGGGLLAELSAANFTLTAGVHSDDANHTHGDGSGTTIGDIATIHEFGAPAANIPARSFVRGWYDEKFDEIRAILKTEIGAAMQGKRPMPVAFERAALRLEGSIKGRIRAHIPPPLAPATVKRKGSSTPLIDTGQLIQAIRVRLTAK